MEGSFASTLGDALLGLGRPVEATTAHTSAINIFRELGLSHEVCAALAGLARVMLEQGGITAALAQIEEILAYLANGGTLDGSNEPLRVHLTCYHVLRAANDPRARAVLERAHAQLQEQAAKISDETMRRLFLENVPYHREIVAAWREGLS